VEILTNMRLDPIGFARGPAADWRVSRVANPKEAWDACAGAPDVPASLLVYGPGWLWLTAVGALLTRLGADDMPPVAHVAPHHPSSSLLQLGRSFENTIRGDNRSQALGHVAPRRTLRVSATSLPHPVLATTVTAGGWFEPSRSVSRAVMRRLVETAKRWAATDGPPPVRAARVDGRDVGGLSSMIAAASDVVLPIGHARPRGDHGERWMWGARAATAPSREDETPAPQESSALRWATDASLEVDGAWTSDGWTYEACNGAVLTLRSGPLFHVWSPGAP